MKKNLTITINNPCLEDWDKMTTNKDGKFCNHCKENVIDFTLLSDKEIIRIFDTHKGKFCGRFGREQLGREIAIPTKENHFSFVAKAAAALLLFTSLKEAKGESYNVVNGTTIYADKIKNNISELINNNPVEISGTVFDASTNKPLPNVRIVITSPLGLAIAKTDYKTDEDGGFAIPLNDSTEKRTITLVFACADHEDRIVKVNNEDYNTTINVYLPSTMEEVVIIKAGRIGKPLIKRSDTQNANAIDSTAKKKHFHFWNLFRSKKNRK